MDTGATPFKKGTETRIAQGPDGAGRNVVPGGPNYCGVRRGDMPAEDIWVVAIAEWLVLFSAMSILPCLLVGLGCGWRLSGVAVRRGLGLGAVVGLVTLALNIGLFFIQGGSLIFVGITLGALATLLLCLWMNRSGSANAV